MDLKYMLSVINKYKNVDKHTLYLNSVKERLDKSTAEYIRNVNKTATNLSYKAVIRVARAINR